MQFRVWRYWLMRMLRGRTRRFTVILGAGLLLIVCFAMRHRPRPTVNLKAAITPPPVRLATGPPGIVLHNSETPARWHGVTVNAARLEAIHAADHPEWATTFGGKVYHIGYHYVILPDGRIEKGRPENCLGMHARTHNDWLGICIIGDFTTHHHWWPDHPTAPQLKSVVALCEYLMSKYHIPPQYVKRHRDINYTTCPGTRFPYRKIITLLNAYSNKHPETRPIPGRVVSVARPSRHQRNVYPVSLGLSMRTR